MNKVTCHISIALEPVLECAAVALRGKKSKNGEGFFFLCQ
jgi:hypothetical protein